MENLNIENKIIKPSEYSYNISLKVIIYIFVVILTTAKGFRIGSSLGFSEIILLLFSLSLIMNSERYMQSKLFRYNNYFWYLITLLLLIGLFVRSNFFSFPKLFPRTLIAYAFCYIVSLGIFKSKVLEKTPLFVVKNYVAVLSSITIFFSMLSIMGQKYLLGVHLYWLDSQRFQGWSLDPNQFTIPFIIAPFIMTYYYINISKDKLKLINISVILIFLVHLGIATDSDSLLLSWIVGGLTTIIFFLKKNLIKKNNVNVVFLLIIVFTIGLLVIYLSINFEYVLKFVSDFLSKDGQAETRIGIWKRSIELIKKSPVFGLGPDVGIDLGRMDIMGESHNNFIHLGMSTGLTGMFLLLIYFCIILKNTIKSGNYLFIGAIISLFVFGLTHYTLRHPSYWAMLLFIDRLSVYEIDKYNKLKK